MSEIPSKTEKPAIPVFERKRCPKDQEKAKSKAVSHGLRPKKSTSGKTGNKTAGQRKPQEKQPDPNSPFAVLAQLKSK